MNLEWTTVWTGDIHGPSRGLLCDKETVFPTREPPPVSRGEAPTRIRPKRDRFDLNHRTTQRIRAALTEREHTIVELMFRLTISRTSVDCAIKALKDHGLLQVRDLPRATYGRKQRVYGIIK